MEHAVAGFSRGPCCYTGSCSGRCRRVRELLRKLLNDEVKARSRHNLTSDELAFYDALEVSDSTVKILGDDTLKTIASQLVETVRRMIETAKTYGPV